MAEISSRAADRSRIAMTRTRFQQAREGERTLTDEERREYRKVREELEADLDLDMDERYAPLLDALVRRVGRRRSYEALFTPERVLSSGVTYPLFNTEVEELLRALGAERNCDARTIERLIEDGVVPPTPQIGKGGLARNAYFARHVLAAAFRVLCVPEDREVLRHGAMTVTGQISREARLLLGILPGADAHLVRRLRQER